MFFDNLSNLPSIAEKSGFSIFVIKNQSIDALNTGKKPIKTATTEVSFNFPPNSFYLEPDKGAIRVDQIRDLEDKMQTKELQPKFFIIKHAEMMNEQAENAALKLLEEPKENCHLIFLTTDLSVFLPTILSRAAIYVLKTAEPLSVPPDTSPEIINDAKLLLSSSPRACFSLINRWTDKKNKKSRTEILQILSTCLEIAYKSYFKTGKTNFLKKLPALIKAYENIKANGHIKLQLAANLC